MPTKLFFFLFNLALRVHHKRIFERASGLAFRVLLAFFPFIVFLMSLMGFLHLDESAILSGLYEVLPRDISYLVAGFVQELSIARSTGLLSAALFFSVYNTTNGFRAIIRCVNVAYGVEEKRGFALQVLLSFVLMMLFSLSLFIMLGLLIFGQHIWGYFFPNANDLIVALSSGAASLVVLIFTTMLIYRLACAKKLPTRHVLPGAIFTVVAWVVASSFFGFVTQNFTQYPAIYGSIAGVFILILWLNVISILLLIGNELNALLAEYSNVV